MTLPPSHRRQDSRPRTARPRLSSVPPTKAATEHRQNTAIYRRRSHLPPTKTCDKGNACLPCGSFATDITHLGEHKAQRERTAAFIRVRQEQFANRNGTLMPDTNVWLQGRLRELASLDAIIQRLEGRGLGQTGAVKGAGTSGKTVPLTLMTDTASREAATQALADRVEGD